MSRFSASEIATWCAGRWESDVPDTEITGFSKDSRTIEEGECYIALIGENHDGHAFVSSARKKGASCAIVSTEISGEAALPLLRVEDSCQALQDIAAGYRAKINPFVVGVTGSSGKTTVKEMIASCLASESKTASTHGNLNNNIGLPLCILSMAEDTQTAVFEIGMNHPGELRPLCNLLKPDWGVVTNVGPVHLENFGSVAEIAKEKAVLLEATKEHAFIDADGLYFDVLTAACGCPITTVSQKQGDYTYKLEKELSVREVSTGETLDVTLPVPGLHIAYDAALATAVARKRGIGWESIKSALTAYEPLAMRWEVQEVSGVKLINDAYNANPMSMRASIRAFLDDVPAERKALVLGDMLELGESSVEEHRALGAWLEGRGVSWLITVGPQSREIAKAASSFCNVESVEAAGEVSGLLNTSLQSGDAVLFKGSRGIKLEVAVSSVTEFLN